MASDLENILKYHQNIASDTYKKLRNLKGSPLVNTEETIPATIQRKLFTNFNITVQDIVKRKLEPTTNNLLRDVFWSTTNLNENTLGNQKTYRSGYVNINETSYNTVGLMKGLLLNFRNKIETTEFFKRKNITINYILDNNLFKNRFIETHDAITYDIFNLGSNKFSEWKLTRNGDTPFGTNNAYVHTLRIKDNIKKKGYDTVYQSLSLIHDLFEDFESFMEKQEKKISDKNKLKYQYKTGNISALNYIVNTTLKDIKSNLFFISRKLKRSELEGKYHSTLQKYGSINNNKHYMVLESFKNLLTIEKKPALSKIDNFKYAMNRMLQKSIEFHSSNNKILSEYYDAGFVIKVEDSIDNTRSIKGLDGNKIFTRTIKNYEVAKNAYEFIQKTKTNKKLEDSILELLRLSIRNLESENISRQDIFKSNLIYHDTLTKDQTDIIHDYQHYIKEIKSLKEYIQLKSKYNTQKLLPKINIELGNIQNNLYQSKKILSTNSFLQSSAKLDALARITYESETDKKKIAQQIVKINNNLINEFKNRNKPNDNEKFFESFLKQNQSKYIEDLKIKYDMN